MPQNTNLNVSPYFDDFNENKNFHKVLFKPGFPVQARELNNLQSILQNQVEKFGQHFFKEGAKVIPGNTTYNRDYHCIQLNNTFQGIPVSAYIDQLVGIQITGSTTGVTAIVDKILLAEDSERNNLTLYVAYIGSSTTNNETSTFSDGEDLVTNTTINSGLLGNSSIAAGTPFATTLDTNAAAIGSSYSIQEGVYFIRGQFVKVEKETLILDQYTNNSNYRVGLAVNEEIINSDIDESLTDNSQGFNNFSAPGADRFRITLNLFKKPLDDLDDNSFVEEAEVIGGELRNKVRTSSYQQLNDELARRTYDESGDYTISPFDVILKNSLNDNIGNRGVFNEGQLTYSGTTPTDDLGVYKVSTGKAYIRGYEVETTSPLFLDCPKPRTVQTIENQAIQYNTGSTLILNRTFGAPEIGIGNTYIVSLRNQRGGADQTIVPGEEVGLARVYDYRLESGSYNNTSNLNEWGISLYDVRTVTKITLNQPVTNLTTPTFVKGANSGATAFLKDAVQVGAGLTLYETNGEFLENESLIFNGIDNGRTAIAVTAHSISDVKSIFATDNGIVGTAKTFNADVVQSTSVNIGIATISVASGGLSTVTSPNQSFPGTLVKVNDLVQFSNPTQSNDPTFGRVTAVGTDTISISNVADVDGLVNGNLPTAAKEVTDFKILTTQLSSSSDNTLYTKLPKDYISNVDLTSASLTVRKPFTVNIASNQLSSVVSAGSSEIFLPFDEERYSLVRSNGSTEPLVADQFSISTDGKTLQIFNLGANDTNAQLVTTLTKLNPKAKEKIRNRINSVIVNKSKNSASGVGTTTLNDGLEFGNYPFGTRVQDEVISLNSPDVIRVVGIYESSDNDDATAPKMTLSNINSASTTSQEFIVGEYIIGQTSGAIACYAERVTDSQITFIYKNDLTFNEGETVVFQESNTQGTITELNAESFEINSSFTFNNGQEKTIYDYGFIERKLDVDSPSRKLKIYFESASYATTDNGDITTVNSYDTFDYAREIQSIDGVSNADILDIRPRVSDYTVTENSRSPLEFLGRTFNSSGQTASSILASDENIITTFSNYLGRIDRIFLDKDGKFQVQYGQPAETPEAPGSVDNAIEIATVSLPPYLLNIDDADIRFHEYKRFRMVDIKNLEGRIKNLEYYTALTLLESNTANLFVPDDDGINRFKSGFFVDNFTNFLKQEDSLELNNSVDRVTKELRPKHYTNFIDLIFGPVSNVSPDTDFNFNIIEGINVRKENDIVTLDYADVEYVKQSFATRSESVTPFIISFWQGSVELTPSTDTWLNTVRLQSRVIGERGNFAETMARASREFGVNPQSGFAPIAWGSWQTSWIGTTVSTSNRITQERGSTSGERQRGRRVFVVDTFNRVNETIRDTEQITRETRTGIRTLVVPESFTESQGDRVVNREIVPFMRSRNVQFVSKRLKPITRLYTFFDGEEVTRFCVPKLLEISMNSGTFQVGETVVGTSISSGLGGSDLAIFRPGIRFRVAQANHKEGQFNIPSKTYSSSPYTQQPISPTYTSNSTLLNVDTFSLSNEARGDFFGYVESGMILKGSTSGAEATITNVRLISDLSAFCAGSFFIPNPNGSNFPRFETGTSLFKLTSDKDNNQDRAQTSSEESYTASGAIQTVQEEIISVRNARIEQQQQTQNRDSSRTISSEVVSSNVVGQRTSERTIRWVDPLAQSFLVADDTGVFLSKCDIFFRSKDDLDTPVTVQIRTMQNGTPSQKVLPLSEVVLDPSDVNLSGDGSVATTVQFKAPVYCEGGKEYAICLLSNSTKYQVYICRTGEVDLISQSVVSQQPYLGSLFKSQNASTWEPSQWEDLKFTLYRADFIENGTVEFYNPELSEGNDQVPVLMPNSLNVESKQVRVGLGTTVFDSGLRIGNTINQMGTLASGNLVGTAGTAAGPDLSITNAGIGYTPQTGQVTYSGVNLVSITGNGRNAVASITVQNGSIVASGATITNGGSGYQVGDVVGFTTLGSTSVGRDARLTITSIGATSELIINEVQGNFVIGAANTITYSSNAGITSEVNFENGGDVQISSVVQDTDGLHIKVNHKNHGMYFSDNIVKLSNVESDIKPTKLSVAYDINSTGSLSVDNAAAFETFENVGVGTTNVGCLRIEDEIIEYTSVDGNLIGGNITRDSSKSKSYPVGTPVYKYELSGVNLKRINKTHNLSDVTKADPITFDSYNIKLDMSETFNEENDNRSNDVGFPQLFIGKTKSTGGMNIRATQNMPFEIITPNIHNMTVSGTSLSAEVRTVTSKSLSGNEIPYIDAGFETVAVNQLNYLESARMIASKVNEDAKLTNNVGNKSLNMRLTLGTTDTRISPVIDGQRSGVILTSNRVNDVISDYTTNPQVRSFTNDPTGCQYISKEIDLENPATSIKIILDGHVNTDSEIRAFYAISDSNDFEPIFTAFPGYKNLNNRGQIIDAKKSDGLSDSLIIKDNSIGYDINSSNYKEYTFTADELPSFKSYRIKIILTSKNQCHVPKIRDLRVLALA